MQKWKRIAAKSAVPFTGLLLLSGGLYTAVASKLSRNDEIDTTGLLIRFTYAALFTIGMEHIARFEHEYLWHSNMLWYFHASHHHQKVHSLGQGPAASVTDRSKKEQSKDNGGIHFDRKGSNVHGTSALERNDIFPVVFSSLAILVLYWGILLSDNTAFRDCSVGSATGISIYGTSYFVGHDLCAHERGGKTLATFLRRASPFMARCADIHIHYHHRVSHAKASNGKDPYGPPYGFWRGEAEVEAMRQGRTEHMKMPRLLRCMFFVSFLFFLYSAYVHFQIHPKMP